MYVAYEVDTTMNDLEEGIRGPLRLLVASITSEDVKSDPATAIEIMRVLEERVNQYQSEANAAWEYVGRLRTLRPETATVTSVEPHEGGVRVVLESVIPHPTSVAVGHKVSLGPLLKPADQESAGGKP